MLTNEKNDSITNKNDYEGKEGYGQNTRCNRRIGHATTATIVNNRFTTKYTLDIRTIKHNHVINSSKLHQNIFEAIKQVDETATIIIHANICITKSNTFITDNEHSTSFHDQKNCKVTKIMYISFSLESTFNLSQIKYGTRYNSTKCILETLRENLAFLKMEKYNSKNKQVLDSS